ncbi:hypothetical protein P4233_01695 [Pseudomonas aeruginosa]|nr:hypothetical protein [Pseudomonas aeruginosa]
MLMAYADPVVAVRILPAAGAVIGAHADPQMGPAALSGAAKAENGPNAARCRRRPVKRSAVSGAGADQAQRADAEDRRGRRPHWCATAISGARLPETRGGEPSQAHGGHRPERARRSVPENNENKCGASALDSMLARKNIGELQRCNLRPYDASRRPAWRTAWPC